MESKSFIIPSMEQSELMQWYKNISPIVHHNDKSFYLRKLTNYEVNNFPFTWFLSKTDYTDEVNYDILTPLADITMLHSFFYHGFFKPYVSEVIQQIPPALISKVTAFEIIKFPYQIKPHELVEEAENSGYHLSVIRLYGSN